MEPRVEFVTAGDFQVNAREIEYIKYEEAKATVFLRSGRELKVTGHLEVENLQIQMAKFNV